MADPINIAAPGGQAATLKAGMQTALGITADSAAYSTPAQITQDFVPSNLNAALAPTVNDDTTQGYRIGSVWYQPSTARQWICRAATAGAALWVLDLRRLPCPSGSHMTAVNLRDATQTLIVSDTNRTFQCFQFESLATIADFTTYVTTAGGAGAQAKYALYDLAPSGKPGKVLFSSAVTNLQTSATRQKLPAPVSVPVQRTGLFWVGAHATGGGTTRPTVIRISNGIPGYVYATDAEQLSNPDTPRAYKQTGTPAFSDAWIDNPPVEAAWNSESLAVSLLLA